uniref:Transposase n=1 Tax=Heterorhabditis bacteriophora TaxID=37862 RepID=A0A1I7WHY5_HETBA
MEKKRLIVNEYRCGYGLSKSYYINY